MDRITEAVPRAGRRAFAGLALLGLPTFLVAMDRSVLYLALPHLSADVGASGVQQLWISDIHDFILAGLVITMGTLGDRIGRKRLLLVGASVFAVASVLAAFATSPEMLIAARTMVGIGAAAIMPSTLALVSALFRDPRQHATAIGVWMGCFTIGAALGPVIGGSLLQSFWWGAAFLLGVPVMLVLLVVGPRLLPEFRNPDAGRIDLPSVALSLLALLPVVYGLKQLARNGPAVTEILAVVIGLASAGVFVVRQRRIRNPLLDLQLFGRSTFSVALALTLLTGVMAGCQLFVSLYMQSAQQLSPLDTALWMLPSTLTTVLVIQLAPLMIRRIRPAYAIAGGLLLQAPGYLMLTTLDGAGNLPLLVTGLVVVAVGVGPIASLCATLTIQAAPPEKAGTAAAMTETSGDFGVAMGIAVLGIVGTTVYRGAMQVDPGVPTAAADAARESIAGAFSAASRLPGEQAGELLRNAYHATAASLNGVAMICAVITVAAAVLAARALRHIPASGRSVPRHDPARRS